MFCQSFWHPLTQVPGVNSFRPRAPGYNTLIRPIRNGLTVNSNNCKLEADVRNGRNLKERHGGAGGAEIGRRQRGSRLDARAGYGDGLDASESGGAGLGLAPTRCYIPQEKSYFHTYIYSTTTMGLLENSTDLDWVSATQSKSVEFSSNPNVVFTFT